MKRSTLAECPMCKGKGRVPVSSAMRFQQVRRDAGLTQLEISNKVNIGRAQWANLEGGRTSPSIELLLRVSDFSGRSVDWLLGRA